MWASLIVFSLQSSINTCASKNVVIGAIVGPIVAGWILDRYESYHFAWPLFAGLVGAAVIIMITTPPVSINTIRNKKYKSS